MKSYTSKASLNITFYHRALECGEKRRKEVILSNVGSTGSHPLLDLTTIRLFQWTKTPNIQRLKYVR